jgi:hypothetical protein
MRSSASPHAFGRRQHCATEYEPNAGADGGEPQRRRPQVRGHAIEPQYEPGAEEGAGERAAKDPLRHGAERAIERAHSSRPGASCRCERAKRELQRQRVSPVNAAGASRAKRTIERIGDARVMQSCGRRIGVPSDKCFVCVADKAQTKFSSASVRVCSFGQDRRRCGDG